MVGFGKKNVVSFLRFPLRVVKRVFFASQREEENA
jgi:hypothetical protein